MDYEPRLIPLLREGVDVIKMVFFKRLRSHLTTKRPDLDGKFLNQLAGAVLNEIFGAPNLQEPYASFCRENSALISKELSSAAGELADMKILLTDALRIQFLCDSQENIDSSRTLERARELNILIVEREVPLPAGFMALVRRVGNAYGILLPLAEGMEGRA